MTRAIVTTIGAAVALAAGMLAPVDWAIPVPPGERIALTGQQATPPPPPPKIKPVTVPASEKAKKNPVPNVPEAVESGRILFVSQCHHCHDKNGTGHGELAKELGMTVADFTNPKWQSKRTDGELFYITRHGHADMPAEKRLLDQQIWETILYIRTLAKPADKP
jgi:mono/diheme cytochrome c family protein